MNEDVIAFLCAAAAIFFAVRAVLAMPADLLGSLIPPALAAVALVMFLVYAKFAAWRAEGTGASARLALTYHATKYLSAHKIRLHEEAHKRKAAQFGAGGRIVEHPDGGYEFLPGWGWSKLTPIQKAAVAYAGQRASGPGGHEIDDDTAEFYLRQVPAAERDAARREAWELAA